MTQPSNTPPNGDFARYVERLTGANAAAGRREDLFQSGGDALASEPLTESAGTPSVQGASKPVTGVNFLKHSKWMIVAWIATQALARLLPGAGFLFIPLLIAYVVWVIFKLKLKLKLTSSDDLKKSLREFALKAIEEAKKSQYSQKK